MTDLQIAKLARIKNYHSRYEIVLTDGTQKFLVLYTSRRSKRGLYAAANQRREALASITGEDGYWVVNGKTSPQMGDGDWRIFFSGRTQRECILDGELPFASAKSLAMAA